MWLCQIMYTGLFDKQDDGRNNEKNNKRITEWNVGRIVEAQNFAPLQFANKSQPKNKFGPQSQNLASIIRGYKTGVTKYARNHHIGFAWQSRFHDHIIRNEMEYQRIKNYIINNPINWKGDKFYND